MKAWLGYISNNQRKGVMALVILIVMLQVIIFGFEKMSQTKKIVDYKVDVEAQSEIDSLKKLVSKKYEPKPFNPNFINEGKGFQLGMSIEEIERLLKYRATGKYVNSANEFQKITKVSDELLAKMLPLFQFPEWTQRKKSNSYDENQDVISLKKIDLNKATLQDLVAIKGIGDYFANAILNEREKLNGFVSLQQIDYIKGLRPEAVKAIKQNAFVKPNKAIAKINVNTATKEQLSQIPYISTYMAREIVVLRSKQETPLQIKDLEKINNFPLDKLTIIRLYLDF